MTFRTRFEPKFHTGERVRVIRETLGGAPLDSEWTVVTRDGAFVTLSDLSGTRWAAPSDTLELAPPGVLDSSAPTCDTVGEMYQWAPGRAPFSARAAIAEAGLDPEGLSSAEAIRLLAAERDEAIEGRAVALADLDALRYRVRVALGYA